MISLLPSFMIWIACCCRISRLLGQYYLPSEYAPSVIVRHLGQSVVKWDVIVAGPSLLHPSRYESIFTVVCFPGYAGPADGGLQPNHI